jgi:peptide/nickel transport system permease protein
VTPIAVYLVKRILGMVPVLFGLTIAVFFILRMIPGNPVKMSLGFNASAQAVAVMTRQLGLDRPLWVQLADYLWNLVHGNLGVSMQSGQPVATLLAQRFPATLELAGGGMVVAVILGATLGVIAALFIGTWVDRAVMVLATIGLSVPVFWLGLILVLVFALLLHWFPVFGYGGLSHLVLPAVSLGVVASAVNARLVRASMAEVLNSDYVRTARAKGSGRARVVLRHALRNALIPAITIMGLQVGSLLGGTVILEQLFGWPGIGSLLITAVNGRDYTLVQGGVLYIALIFLLVNLAVDLLYSVIDPRVRYG